jgi:hypothetical protein
MKAYCEYNLFGNANFTVDKTYNLKKYGKTHLIETDYKGCELICNLNHSKARNKFNFGFGMCGFRIVDSRD